MSPSSPTGAVRIQNRRPHSRRVKAIDIEWSQTARLPELLDDVTGPAVRRHPWRAFELLSCCPVGSSSVHFGSRPQPGLECGGTSVGWNFLDNSRIETTANLATATLPAKQVVRRLLVKWPTGSLSLTCQAQSLASLVNTMRRRMNAVMSFDCSSCSFSRFSPRIPSSFYTGLPYFRLFRSRALTSKLSVRSWVIVARANSTHSADN